MSVTNPHPALFIYSFCKEFKTLPDKGGYYDQSPELITYFSIISDEIGKVDRAKQKDAERKNRSSGKGRVSRRR